MKLFTIAARTHWFALLACSLTLSLSACGDDSAATTAAANSTSTSSTEHTGTIDRTPVPTLAQTAPATHTPVSTAPKTPVKAASSGAATLDWTPPTENSDGSTLTNLAGYHLYYGTSANDLSQSVQVSNPGLAAYTVANLPAGTWYFAVTSYSSAGVESARSATVSVSL
jgi:hypothetical protein